MLLTPRLFVLEHDPEQTDRNAARTLARSALPLPLPSICVVPRGLCSFRRVRLAGAGANANRNALKAAHLKSRQEALPHEDGSLIIADKGEAILEQTIAPMASIWGFSKSQSHTGRYLPESLAQDPMTDGVRLVKGLSGYEAQIWADKNLAASRWWPTRPSAAAWDVFIRSVQENLNGASRDMPEPVTVPWRRDLSVLSAEREQLQNWFSAGNLASATATLLACGFAYIGAQYVRESITLRTAQSEIADLSDETKLILSQQRRALANMRYSQKYSKLGRNDNVLEGLSALSSVLGQTDLAIERFNIRLGQIEARLTGKSEISVPDVVALLEASNALENVSVSLDARGSVLINADLSNAAEAL